MPLLDPSTLSRQGEGLLLGLQVLSGSILHTQQAAEELKTSFALIAGLAGRKAGEEEEIYDARASKCRCCSLL